MSERGGAATQSGIIYQNSITALYLGRLCDSSERPTGEQAVSVRAEALTEVDDTVITYADGHCEYIQAKENITKSDEAWTKLWQDFEKQFDSKEFKSGKDKFVLQIGFPQKEHHLLLEICERAVSSLNIEEWLKRLTKEQISLLDKIKSDFIDHKSDDEYLFSLLRHLRVSIFSLYQIEKDLIHYWIPKTNRSSLELFRLLRDRVGGEARRRGNFTAPELLKSLADESGIKFSIQPSIEELDDIAKKCGAGLRQHKNTFGDTDIHLKRQITDDVIAWVNEKTEKNVAFILDQAGMGKTVVMRDVLENLDQQNISVLAFKADQLSGVRSKEDFQSKLGLPDEIERILIRLAAIRKTVLIIDQIDALSLSLAHDQTTLDILLELIAGTRLIGNLKIVISCRDFDYNNDPRLAKIETDKKFHINELSDEEVKFVLERNGFSAANLSPATRKLLRVPLHLDLLMLSVNQTNEVKTFNFLNAGIELKSLQDLYSLLWQTVVCKADSNAPSKTIREKVLEIVTTEMNRKQRVSVPQSLITKSGNAELIAAADWLASHGILTPYKNEWNLIHQTFFDYCYAKNFVENNNNLYETVFNGDQGLFVRPQIIQVLGYLRNVDFGSYIRELTRFLFEAEVRFHLRDHVLRWFAALSDPSDEEWILARRLMQNPDSKKRLMSFMSGNTGWFKYLKPMLIRALETQDDTTLDTQTIQFLSSFADAEQSEIAKMMRPYLKKSEAWGRRVHYVLTAIRDWREKEAVDLFEEYFNNTATIERADYFELKRISEFDRKATCRFAVRLLNIVVEQITNNLPQYGVNYVYSIDSELEVLNGSTMVDILDSLVENESEYFLELIIPWIEKVIELGNPNEIERFPDFKSDPLSRFWDGGVYVVHHQIIQSVIKSLTKLAESNPSGFLKQIERLSNSEFQTPQKLVARIFTNLPEKYTAEAFDFLTADNRRLYLGESEVFESRQLVKEIAPFLTDEQIKKLEQGVFSLFQRGKFSTKTDFYYLHRNQMFLLQSIPTSRLSSESLKYLAELERKFPGEKALTKPRSFMMTRAIGSPISSNSVERMSDKAWLRAMKKYEKGFEHKDFFKGGAGELAGHLKERIKAEPQRFYKLALRASVEIDAAYVNAFVNGMTESEVEASKVFDVVRHFSSRNNRNYIRSFAWALDKRAKEDFPDDLLEKLKEYLQLPMGEDETWWQKNETNQQRQGYYDGINQGPYSSYLNSDRGAVFRLIMRIFNARKNSVSTEERWNLIEFAIADESIALKAGAVEELIYLINQDRERSVGLFLRLIEQTPSLLSMRYSLDFIFYTLPKYYEEMKPLIVAAMNEKYEAIQQRAAELVCLASLHSDITNDAEVFADVSELLNSTFAGLPSWRRGIANIYVHNVDNGKYTEICLENLTKLLNDSDDQVRHLIAGMFMRLNEESFPKSKDFITDYSNTDNPVEGEHTLTEFLWEHGILDPEWSLSVVNILLENRYKLETPTHYRNGEYLVRLILRIYADQSLSPNIRESVLNTFDNLMLAFPGDTIRILNEWDRK